VPNLIDFCVNIGCNLCDEIISGAELDEEVNCILRDKVLYDGVSWHEVREVLSELPTNVEPCSFYQIYYGEYLYMDESMLADYINEVAEWADRHDAWTDEDGATYDTDNNDGINVTEDAEDSRDTGSAEDAEGAEDEDFAPLSELLNLR